MKFPLKPRRDFTYAGHRVKKGQKDFSARTASDAKLLKAIGHAEDWPVVEPRAVPPPAPSIQPSAPQTYRTRMLTAEEPARVFAPAPEITAKADRVTDINDMDVDALHELAKARGVWVHHRAGAERVRQALREAEPDAAAE